MKHIITVDSIFEVMRLEATVSGASYYQLKSIDALEEMSTRTEEYNPYLKAELDVDVKDGKLQIVISEADKTGNLITNGSWCRMTIDVHGNISMTTSEDPERIDVYEAPT